MKKNRVTQKDIADHLGVHRTTVSLALNDHPGLPETTRARVRQAAESLGYTPDPMLSALAAYRTQKRPPSYHGKLAWLINSSDGYDWRRIPHFVDYFKGATEAALKKGYQLEIFDLNTPKISPRRMAGILRARSISGILVPPLPHPQMNVPFPWKDFAAVSFGHTLATPRLHTVAVGHYRSTRRLLRELSARGYRRIGIALNPEHDSRIDYNYTAAYLADRQELGRIGEVPILHGPMTPDSGDIIHSWIKQYQPDAIVTSIKNIIPIMNKLGWKIPEDIGVACLSKPASGPEGDLAVILEDSVHLGAVAVNLVINMIRHREKTPPTTPIQIIVEGKWHPGKTLKA